MDSSPVEITSLETDDSRRVIVNVAGPAALLVAKVHKLGERLATPHRLVDKDAGDVYRLFEATSLSEMLNLVRMLLADERSATVTDTAIGYVRQLFATPAPRHSARRASPRPCGRPDDGDDHLDGLHPRPHVGPAAVGACDAARPGP